MEQLFTVTFHTHHLINTCKPDNGDKHRHSNKYSSCMHNICDHIDICVYTCECTFMYVIHVYVIVNSLFSHCPTETSFLKFFCSLWSGSHHISVHFFAMYHSIFDVCFLQPGLSEEVRKKIGEAAVRAAKAVSYVGAGGFHKYLCIQEFHKYLCVQE